MADTPTQKAWMNALMEHEDETVDTYAVAVAFALFRHLDRTGQCRPSVRRLAAMARCSANVVVDRVARLEAAGFLSIKRRTKAVSGYTLTLPSVVSGDTDTQMDTPSDLSHEERQTDGGPPESVVPESESVSPGATEGVEGSTPTSREPVTHQADAKPAKVTPKRILTEMARRKLQVSRQMRLPSAPPEGCEKRRETGWLKKVYEELVAEYGFELDLLMARHPDRDPDYYVWKLDRDLARRDWLQPTWQETRAKLDRERAEQEANRLTPEQLEEEHAKARQLAAELRERAGLRLVTTEAS